LRDQSNVFRNVGVRGTSPLAIHNTVEIGRIMNIRWFHKSVLTLATGPLSS
jgi:hypothetical protein